MTAGGAGGRPAALITGVGRQVGIAAGIAARLADDGWNLGLSYWRPYDADLDPTSSVEEPEQIAADLRTRGASVVLLPTDLADPTVPDRLIADTVAALGPMRGLVLSHAESRDSGILDTTVESFDRHMIVNARASWQLMAAFARQATGGGAVVALTSDHVAYNMPYGASKGAVISFTRRAAGALGSDGIRVNAIAPGAIDTSGVLGLGGDNALPDGLHVPLSRMGTPDDIATVAVFLASDAARYVNGVTIVVDGGLLVV